MKGQICLMPEQCTKCGKLFDLSYDFQGLSKENMMSEVFKKSSRSNKVALQCWVCRDKK